MDMSSMMGGMGGMDGPDSDDDDDGLCFFSRLPPPLSRQLQCLSGVPFALSRARATSLCRRVLSKSCAVVSLSNSHSGT